MGFILKEIAYTLVLSKAIILGQKIIILHGSAGLKHSWKIQPHLSCSLAPSPPGERETKSRSSELRWEWLHWKSCSQWQVMRKNMHPAIQLLSSEVLLTTKSSVFDTQQLRSILKGTTSLRRPCRDTKIADTLINSTSGNCFSTLINLVHSCSKFKYSV